MKILITGRDGQVGWELCRALRPLGEVSAFDRSALALAQADSICAAVRAVHPDVIVNAAAYTAVDKAESEPGLARAINAWAPGILAEEAKRCGALLVHYSTDYVFDGRKAGPYVEDDPTNPLSVYGQSKLEGERAIQAVDCRHVILRTAWVYADRGKNFMLTIARLAHERPELRVVNDQFGQPTNSRNLAKFIKAFIFQPPNPGIYHFTDQGYASRVDFARQILFFRGFDLSLIRSVSTKKQEGIAVRPKFCLLAPSNLLYDDVDYISWQ